MPADDDARFALANAVRHAVIDAMCAAHEDAGMQGLCGEGRFEVAIDTVRNLDLRPILAALDDGATTAPHK